MPQVAWRYADIEPDFIVGAAAAAIYISVQYHLLHPTYLKSRLVSLDGKFRVRILLVHVVRRAVTDLIRLDAPAASDRSSMLAYRTLMTASPRCTLLRS